MFCPKCGKELEDLSVKCTGCEFDLSFLNQPEESLETEQEAQPEAQPEVMDETQPEVKPEPQPEVKPELQTEASEVKQPRKGKSLVNVIVAVLVIGLIGFGISQFAKPKNQMPVLYFKDDALLLKNANMKESIEITDDFTDDSDLANSEDFHDSMSGFIELSEDGKNLFFVTDIEVGDDSNPEITGKLYTRSTTSEKASGKDETGTVLAEEVSYVPTFKDHFYRLVGEDQGLVYMTDYEIGDGGKLYYHDFKESVEIDKDVLRVYFAKEGSLALYEKASGDEEIDLYQVELKKGAEPVKIANNIPAGSINEVSDDLKTIYYTESGQADSEEHNQVKVHVIKDGKVEKVASDVEQMVSDIDAEKGGFFFSRYEKKKVKLSDLLEDDLKAADAAMVEPKESDFQHTEEAYDYWYGTYTTTVTDWDRYYAASQKYSDKLNRDAIRDYANTTEKELDTYNLYYYENGKEEKIAENYSDISFSDAKYKIAQYKSNKLSSNKLKISTITSSYDLDMQVYDMNSSEPNVQLFAKGESQEVTKSGSITSAGIYGEGKFMLYILNENSDGTDPDVGDLMKVDLSGDKIGKAEKIAKNVSRYKVQDEGNIIYYYTKMVNDAADLYKLVGTEDEKIGSDVRVNYTLLPEEDGPIYAIEDYSSDKSRGDLISVKGTDKVKISEDVFDFVVAAQNRVYMLKDYKNKEGNLYEWKGKDEPVEVDTDVNYLVPLDGTYF